MSPEMASRQILGIEQPWFIERVARMQEESDLGLLAKEFSILMLAKSLFATMFLLSLSTAYAQPTISGVNAFWWLGSGVLHDGGGCSTGGACYYAQSALTANANGTPGTPTWTVTTVRGGGTISLSCYTCAKTVATSTAPSNGCTYDVSVYVTYPNGTKSSTFKILINEPKKLVLQSGYPVDNPWYPQQDYVGYLSSYVWQVTDSCSYTDTGLNFNETFGTFSEDYPGGDNWSNPTASAGYFTNQIADSLGHADNGTSTPVTLIPQTPRTTTKVRHDYPWNLFLGSQTFGAGVSVQTDTQQWWLDHGTHQ